MFHESMKLRLQRIVLGLALRLAGSPPVRAAPAGITKIQHVVVIMQENRSFDSYFGTFPGADGIPMQDGEPTVCAPDPKTHDCVRPYHDPNDRNVGGPHTSDDARDDIDAGRMDGFVRQAGLGRRHCTDKTDPRCAEGLRRDVMGYHDDREIPNYWTYARRFVLQDRMFEPTASWSLPAHLFLVSAWSAVCEDHTPMSCRNALDRPGGVRHGSGFRGNSPDFAWTNLTHLL